MHSVFIFDNRCCSKQRLFLKDDRTYLKHIAEAIETIEEYTSGLSFDRFLGHKMVIDAVVRELEIIGEASSQLSSVFTEEHSEIPFRDATDMRNFLIHEYFGVNAKVVWDTCNDDLPNLKQLIGKFLKDL